MKTLVRRSVALGAGLAWLFLMMVAPLGAQQAGVLAGTVADQQTGEPLVGAQISVAGTQLGGLTGDNGQFRIEDVPPGNYEVRAQFLGRADQARTNVRVRAGETTTLEFRLRQTALTLEEVVATGVVDPIEGVKIPFSVGRLTADDLPVPTTHSALKAIQGKVAGVTIRAGSGQPGTGVSILLRSPTSIVRNNTPMFVVDGVILRSAGAGTMDLESMDIESIEVVKGAAAAALYGSRASAGVIEIRTRRGQGLERGSTQIRVRSELGLSELPKGVPLADHHHFQTNEQGQFVDGDGNPVQEFGDRVVADDRMMDKPYAVPTFDNISRFFTPELFSTSQVALGHNSQSTNFWISGNHYRERGNIETINGFERVNVRLNVDHRLRDDFTFFASAMHTESWRDRTSGSPFWNLLMYDPVVDLRKRDDDGNFLPLPDSSVIRENPLWRQSTRENMTWRGRTLLSGQADFRPARWFRMDGNFSYDRADISSQIYVPKGVNIATSLDEDDVTSGRLDLRESISQVYNGSASAHFINNFGDLNARLSLRYLMELEKRDFLRGDSRDPLVRDVETLNVGQDQRTRSSYVEIQAEGFFAQLGLDYQGKYIGDFLVRRDGSSLFGPDNRWSTYYRVSGAYRLAQEPWWPAGLDFLNEFKLRGSQGTAGGRPNFSDQYETWSVSSSGAVSKSTLGNRNLGPEHTTETELGVDLIAFDRYQLELTYAKHKTTDQIIQIPQPAVTGYSNQWRNSGTIEGTSWEASFQAQVMQTPNFRWNATVVADRSTSEITEWNRVCYLVTLTIRCDGANRSEVWGDYLWQSFDDLPSYHQGSEGHFDMNDDGYLVAVGEGNSWRDGLWGTQVEVDGRSYDWGHPIVDRDADGNVDVQHIADAFPDFSMGLINQFHWGNVSVHSHLHAEVGAKVYNRTKQRLYQHFRHGDLDQAGKPEEQKKPVDYYQSLYNANNVTSHFVDDGSYLKLRELRVAYQFNQDVLSRIGLARLGMQRMSLGLVGRNIVTLTPYDGYDPEVGGVTVRHDNFSWPNVRHWTAEVEINF